MRDSFSRWWQSNPGLMAAGLSYFSLFSLAPLLVLVISFAEKYFEREQVVSQLVELIGVDATSALQDWSSAISPHISWRGTILSVVILLYVASRIFLHLRLTMNRIWNLEISRKGLKGFVNRQALSFLATLMLGLLIIGLIWIDVIMALILGVLGAPSDNPGRLIIWRIFRGIFSVSFYTIVCGAVYRYAPDIRLRWKDVLPGALFAALSFWAAKGILRIYFAHRALGDLFGAASSFVVFLVWMYCSAQILFLGAHMSRLYAERFGSHRPPADRQKPHGFLRS